MRLVHDSAFRAAGRLADIVAGSLTEAQAANIRHEFYHVCRAELLAYLEAARLERKRLRPLEGGER